MKQFLGLMILSLVVVALLVIAHAMMAPLPMTATTTALGGLIAMWLFRQRSPRGITIGAASGALIGTALHAYSHVLTHHTHAHDGIAHHIVTDAAFGIAIGIVALAIPFAIARLTRRVESAPQHR